MTLRGMLRSLRPEASNGMQLPLRPDAVHGMQLRCAPPSSSLGMQLRELGQAPQGVRDRPSRGKTGTGYTSVPQQVRE